MKAVSTLPSLIVSFILFLSMSAYAGSGCKSHSDCSDGKGCFETEPGNDEEKDDDQLFGSLFGDKDLGDHCPFGKGQCQTGACEKVCKERDSDGNCKKDRKECVAYKECMLAPQGEKIPDPNPTNIKCEGWDDDQAKTEMDPSTRKCTGGSLKWVVLMPENIDVGSFDESTCAVTINQNSYEDFLNNFYSLAAFEFLFQNTSNEVTCLDTTHRVKDEIAQPLKKLHENVAKVFKTDYFEGYLAPADYLAKHSTEAEANCGQTQEVMANLNSVHYYTNMILLYGDKYTAEMDKNIASSNNPSGDPNAAQVTQKSTGLTELPAGNVGYMELFPRATKISDDYYNKYWGHWAKDFYSGNKCRRISWKFPRRNHWMNRYRLPDGIPEDLLKFVHSGKVKKNSLNGSDIAKASIMSAVSPLGAFAFLAMYYNSQPTFVDPPLPEGMPFKDQCGGTFAGKFRRRCKGEDLGEDKGFVKTFKGKIAEYYAAKISGTDGAGHLFGMLSAKDEVQTDLSRMAFGNFFWFSFHKNSARHPLAHRKIAFRLIENNLYSLTNYLKKMVVIRKKAAECFQKKAQELQALCYDPDNINTTDYEKDKDKKGKKDKKTNPNATVKKGVPGIAMKGGTFVPNFTSLVNKGDGTTGAINGSPFEGGMAGVDAGFNKALDDRKRELKSALDKLSPKDKEINSGFNKDLVAAYSLSPASLSSGGGNDSKSKGFGAMGAAVKKEEKKEKKEHEEVKAKVAPVADVPDADLSKLSDDASKKTEESGPSAEEVDSMLTDAKSDKYKASDEDGLFEVVSKAYVREGYQRLLKKKANLDTEQKETKKEEVKALDKIQDIH